MNANHLAQANRWNDTYVRTNQEDGSALLRQLVLDPMKHSIRCDLESIIEDRTLTQGVACKGIQARSGPQRRQTKPVVRETFGDSQGRLLRLEWVIQWEKMRRLVACSDQPINTYFW